MNLRAGLPQGLAVVVLDNSGACVLQGRNVSLTASHGAKFQGRFILFGSKVTVRPPLAKCKKFAPRNQNGIFAGYSTSITSVARAGPLAAAMRTMVALRPTDSRSRPGGTSRTQDDFLSQKSNIQTGTRSHGADGAVATV